ncbi:hypothetical protein TWF481_007621 [Arthrobotrys musiformis]|uniref:Uncharacterized protein n=1 Tax=Arthrobotrys musiformis TaxID=47236 RepID=A0AAV9WC08_9PEZI
MATETETGPEERAVADMPASENLPASAAGPVDAAAIPEPAGEAGPSISDVIPEKKDILFFPLRYTRIRNYWGFPELAFDDINNDPQEVQVEYCESDPKVYDFFIKCTFIKPIVALYEPTSKTLVRREDIIKIKDIELPNGQDTVWSLVYKKPETKMTWWENLLWASKIMLRDEFSPILYIEDLEQGRYNDTLYDVVSWHWQGQAAGDKTDKGKTAPQSAEAIV